jgi:integration host factor subunit beta
MTRSELITFIARRRHDLPAADIELAVSLIIKTISEALARDERIEVRGFGAFSLHHLKPRIGRNPKTGESVALPSRRSIHFKLGKELREAVNYG